MPMITEKGTLPVGIEIEGKVHREFEVRPALVRDAVEVAKEYPPRQLLNETFYGVCLAAKQIVRIGDIAPVHSEQMLDLTDIDFREIGMARERLAKRLVTFRDEPASGEGTESKPGAEHTERKKTRVGASKVAGANGDGT